MPLGGVAAAEGILGHTLDYADWIGIWANLDRQRAVQSIVAANGYCLATGRPVADSFYLAIARDAAEAEQMAYDARTRRREAASLAKHGWTTS